jgi:hypothetical protein
VACGIFSSVFFSGALESLFFWGVAQMRGIGRGDVHHKQKKGGRVGGSAARVLERKRGVRARPQHHMCAPKRVLRAPPTAPPRTHARERAQVARARQRENEPASVEQKAGVCARPLWPAAEGAERGGDASGIFGRGRAPHAGKSAKEKERGGGQRGQRLPSRCVKKKKGGLRLGGSGPGGYKKQKIYMSGVCGVAAAVRFLVLREGGL